MRAQQCDPAGGYAHRFMRTVTPYSARWPDHLRVGNAAHAHIKGLTRRSRGLRASGQLASGCKHSDRVITDSHASSRPPELSQNADHLTRSS